MVTSQETDKLPPLLITAVGSLPHTDAAEAVDLVLESLCEAPHAPQLSRLDPREQMWIQYSEGLPGFHVDLKNLSYYFDTSGDLAPVLEEFYSSYLEVMEGGSADKSAIGPAYGQGIHELLRRLAREGKRRSFLKLQVTGPLSFALTVNDEKGKPIFYHPEFRDVAVKGLGLKAVWLADKFKPYADEIIIFFDEPGLSAYGSSALLGVSKADVIECLDEVFSMAREKDAIPGIHCCGNTDWGLLMETSASIINFDAVDYMETLPIYARNLNEFLKRGGVLAWGAVPNTEKAEHETAGDVIRRVRAGMDLLEKAGIDRTLLTRKVVLTPSCGCAGLTVGQTSKVYGLLSELERMNGAMLF